MRRLRAWYASKSSVIPTGIFGSVFFFWFEPQFFYSLDCRHVFCGLCIASWFVTKQDNSCPECRVKCFGLPQRDFALRDILRVVYGNLGREAPTYDTFDQTIFARIYELLREFRTAPRTRQQRLEFWAPIVAEVQQMCGGPAQTPASTPDVIVIDVDMEGNSGVSDLELDEGVDSEESEGESETGNEGGMGIVRVED